MRTPPTNASLKNGVWLLLSLAACAISWFYANRVLLPWEYYVNVTRGQFKAQMGDLYPRWVGTRELLLNGKNPYSDEVSHEIQMAFYGHSIEQTYNKPATEILDEQRFVYPVYVVFLLAPTVHWDFARLQAWAPFALGAFAAITVWLWIDALRWRPSLSVLLAVILLILSSPQIAQGLRLRQLGLLVVFLLALASWCVIRGSYVAAGVLLALATIKPQMVILCLLWFAIWLAGDWKKRWRLAAGFVAATALLVGAGEWLLPRWPVYFVQGLIAYWRYFPLLTTSPLRLILGDWLGGIVSLAALAALVVYGWRKRAVAETSAEFMEVLALFFVASTLILPLLTPYNQVLLLLTVTILLRDWKTAARWQRIGFTLLVAWPPVVSLIMLAHPPQLQSLHRTPLLPSALVLLFPFLMLWFVMSRRKESDRASLVT